MVAGIEQIFSFPSFDQTFDICQLRALVCVCVQCARYRVSVVYDLHQKVGSLFNIYMLIFEKLKSFQNDLQPRPWQKLMMVPRNPSSSVGHQQHQ